MNRRALLAAVMAAASLAGCASPGQSRYEAIARELADARSRRDLLATRLATEKLEAEIARLKELIAALDQRISDLLQELRDSSAGMSRYDNVGSDGGGSGSSGGCGSRGGAGYRLPSGKCASRRR